MFKFIKRLLGISDSNERISRGSFIPPLPARKNYILNPPLKPLNYGNVFKKLETPKIPITPTVHRSRRAGTMEGRSVETISAIYDNSNDLITQAALLGIITSSNNDSPAPSHSHSHGSYSHSHDCGTPADHGSSSSHSCASSSHSCGGSSCGGGGGGD